MKRITRLLLVFVLSLPIAFAQEEGGWDSTEGYSLREIRALTEVSMPGGDAIDLELPPPAARSSGAEPAAGLAVQQKSFAIAPTPVVAGNFADQITPEIQSLARGLQYDPLNIFHFVRNRVAYECYYGSKKGAHLTLMEMGGNDYDQSSLMVALLRASGYQATYAAAPVDFTYQYLSSSTGIENPYAHLSDVDFAAEISTPQSPVLATDPDLPQQRKIYGISGFFLNRGWPIVAATTDASIFTLSHVWVRCTIDGQQVNVSPSIKAYSWSAGINVTPAGMNKAAILAAAAGTVNAGNGKKWVKGLQYGALENLLSSYTNQVLASLKNNHDGESMDDLLGAPRIIPIIYPDLASAIQISASPAGWSSFETWNETAIPEVRMAKVEFIGGDYIVNGSFLNYPFSKPLYRRSYTMAELAGRKLSLTFEGTDSKTATFSLDDVPDSTFTTFGFMFNVATLVSHPHFSLKRNQSNVYEKVNVERHNSIVMTGYNSRINEAVYPGNTVPSCYAIVSSFGNPRKLLRKRQEILESLRKTYPDTDNRVRTEALNIMGLSWYDQTWRYSHFAAIQMQMLPLFQHRIGTVAQQSSYFIDVTQQRYSLSHRGQNTEIARKFLGIESLVHSAMEHAVVDQSVGQPVAVSTVEMIWRANNAGEEIHRMQSDTWDAEKGNLTNYSTNDIAFLDGVFDLDGSIGLMPKSGNRTVNSWQGAGYATITASDFHQMRISGGLNGGFASILGYIGSNPLMQHLWSDPAYIATPSNVLSLPIIPYTTPRLVSWDPVDMLSGAFLLDETDLNLGRLSFSRHYNSHQRNNDLAGLGNGWTHGHDIRLSERSSTAAALGETNTYQAVAMYVGSLAANMVYDNGSAKDWTVAALITRWSAAMTFNNAVGITFGNKTVEFIRMPDGTFIPPPGMSLTLTKTGGTPATATTPAVLGIYTLAERNGLTYLFNAKGRISKITDPNGNTQTFNYNTNDQLTTVVDSFGHTFTYGWSEGRIDTVSDGTGRVVTLGYTSGNLTSVKDVENKTHTYQYDSGNRMESKKDAQSRFIILNEYDAGNRVTRQRGMGDQSREWHYAWSGTLNLEQDPTGAISGYHYDKKGRSIGITNPLGYSSSTGYDGQDRIIYESTPKGEETTRTYNSDNNVVTETDPKGKTTSFSYDSLKRLQKVTNKKGKEITYTYTAAHQIETSTDQLGHVTSYTYRGDGLLQTTQDGEGKIKTNAYDGSGYINRITYHDGKFHSFINNARGDVLSSTDPVGRTVVNTWNSRRQLLTSTLPGIQGEAPAVTTNVYDDLGNLQSTTDPNGHTTSFTYNALGKKLTTTQPAIAAGQNVITHDYDVRDLVISTTNSSGHSTHFEYDTAKRLLATVDSLGRRTEQQYDENNQVTQIKQVAQINASLNRIRKQTWSSRGEKEEDTDALDKTAFFEYDDEGNQVTLKNRNGKTFQFGFDDANRPTSTSTPSGKITSTTYYNNNQVRSITEASGQVTTLTYNAKNLVATKADSVGTIAYTYDDSGLLLTSTQGGDVITRTYDERGRLKTFQNADGDLMQYRYDPNGNLIKLIYPDGKEVSYTYNSRNLMESVKDWNDRTTAYSYDHLGRLTEITRLYNGTKAVMSYDDAGQLIEQRETSGGRLISLLRFTHDELGQIERRFRAPLVAGGSLHPLVTCSYDDDNRLATVNGQSVTLDSDGNMTSGPISPDSGNVSLSFNARNQLTHAGGLNYTYDAEGVRRSIVGPSGTTRDVIDPSGKVSCLLIRHHPDGSKTFYVHGLGLLYEVDDSDATKTYHYDQVGSTIFRTNDAGVEIGWAEYSAYGLVLRKSGDMATPFLFNGQLGIQTDSNGLLNMRARYYGPYLMRFLNADPIGFGGGLNWFAYADGNPVSKSDPSGLDAIFLYGENDNDQNYFRKHAQAQAIEFNLAHMDIVGYKTVFSPHSPGPLVPIYRQTEIAHVYPMKDTFEFNTALSSVKNISNITYVGHAWGLGDKVNLSQLDRSNVLPTARIYLNGCATGVDDNNSGTFSAQRFADAFGLPTRGVTEGLSFGMPVPYFFKDRYYDFSPGQMRGEGRLSSPNFMWAQPRLEQNNKK